MRRTVRLVQEDGIHEHLRGELDVVTLARTQRHRRGEVPAGARASDRDAARVEAERRRVREQPERRGEAVVERDRESILGARR